MEPIAEGNPPVVTQTVLVVDDDDRIRALLRMSLAALGFEVTAAGGGGEALALLAGEDYDAVLCDLIMPEMSGDELFRICRERWPHRASHFIFLSGYPAGFPAAEFALASGQPFLAKPCRLSEIRLAIERVGAAG